jgi:long-chain acyl-CoA synthetase
MLVGEELGIQEGGHHNKIVSRLTVLVSWTGGLAVSDTIPSRVFRNAKSNPLSPAYAHKRNGAWESVSWKSYAGEVRQCGKALMALGIETGNTVSILGFNRPEWIVFDLGVMSIGGAAAGVYTTCSAKEVQYIVDHAESQVILLEDAGQWEKVKAHKRGPDGDQLPRLEHAVMMRDAAPIDDPMVLSWNEFLALGDGVGDDAFDERLTALEPDRLATLIYTSGTTGPPKGVMLSHENLIWTAKALRKIFGGRASDNSVSFLPLAHIAEQLLSIHLSTLIGGSIYFAESIDKVLDNLKEVQPSIVFGVPRIWEKFHAGVTTKLKEATGTKAHLITWVRKVTAEVNRLRNMGREPGLALALQYRLADRLVLAKLKTALGMGRARLCVSGAAPIGHELLEFFASLDIVVYEVYGQSEDTGPTSFNVPGHTRLGTVGRPIPGVDVAIADDGEILVKGNNVFLGYLKDPAATAETLVDGWLHSGDLGVLDGDGYLTITGRKKDIIITSGGKNVAPKNIESTLKNHELINEAMVIGDRRKYLTALITIDEEAAAKLEGDAGGNSRRAVEKAVQSAVDEVNRHLAQVETIKKFTILARNFTVEDGELTPTLKLKRDIVINHFAADIDAMY